MTKAKATGAARTIYMDERLWKRLRILALRRGMSTSEAIRRAVEFAWFDSSTQLPQEPDAAESRQEVSA